MYIWNCFNSHFLYCRYISTSCILSQWVDTVPTTNQSINHNFIYKAGLTLSGAFWRWRAVATLWPSSFSHYADCMWLFVICGLKGSLCWSTAAQEENVNLRFVTSCSPSEDRTTPCFLLLQQLLQSWLLLWNRCRKCVFEIL